MIPLGRPLTLILLTLATACSRTPTPPPSPNLPPAYAKGRIIDPKLEEVARRFTVWTEEQRAGGQPVFARIEVLPPTETLLPYGLGAYQKELRLPVIVTVGPGWSGLQPAERESLASKVFEDLAARIEALMLHPPLRPTLTVQTPQGLELGWINDVTPGRKLLHGDSD